MIVRIGKGTFSKRIRYLLEERLPEQEVLALEYLTQAHAINSYKVSADCTREDATCIIVGALTYVDIALRSDLDPAEGNPDSCWFPLVISTLMQCHVMSDSEVAEVFSNLFGCYLNESIIIIRAAEAYNRIKHC